MATHSTEIIKTPEAGTNIRDASPIIENITGSFLFDFKGHTYGATTIEGEDISRILRGIRNELQAADAKKAVDIGAEVSSGKKDGSEALAEGQVAIGDSAVIANESIKVESFLKNLHGDTSVMPSGHARGIFKAKEGVRDIIFAKYKGSFENAQNNPVLENQNFMMDKDCFILSQADAEALKVLLNNLSSGKFKVLSEFDGGFVAFFNGVEVPFLFTPVENFRMRKNKSAINLAKKAALPN